MVQIGDKVRIVGLGVMEAYQVFQFFIDIPGNGDRNNVRNKDLLQYGEVISSGTVD